MADASSLLIKSLNDVLSLVDVEFRIRFGDEKIKLVRLSMFTVGGRTFLNA
jgi:hypothetical protein